METKKELSEISNNWRVIPGLESYAINEDGVVKALPKIREGRLDCLNNHKGTANKSQRFYGERIIKPYYTSRYWYVNLMHNGIKKDYRVHRLVYRAFIGEIPNDMVIDHIDGNRDNNSLNNLRCVTRTENAANPNTKYNGCNSILQIDSSTYNVVNKYKSMSDACVALGVEYKPGLCNHIGECCTGKRRTTLGFCWQFEELWNAGIKCIRPNRTKSVVQLDLNGNAIAEYPSIKAASKSTGISSSDIVKCAKGKKLNKQYIWKYKENL